MLINNNNDNGSIQYIKKIEMDEYFAEYEKCNVCLQDSIECVTCFGCFLWLNRKGMCLHLSENKYLHFIKILELAQAAKSASQRCVYAHSNWRV